MTIPLRSPPNMHKESERACKRFYLLIKSQHCVEFLRSPILLNVVRFGFDDFVFIFVSLLLLGNEARAVIIVAVTRHDIIVDRLLLHQRLIIIPNVQMFAASACRLVQLS